MDTNSWLYGLDSQTRDRIEDLHLNFGATELNTGDTRPRTRVYWVDNVNGSDTGFDGLSPQTPFATILKGLNMARYLPGTSTIDDTKDHHAYVFVAPGHYNDEALLFAGYNIHLIGLGPGVPGKDYGVSINYDGDIAATAVLAWQGSGIHLANLHIEVQEAIPGIYCAAGNNNLIENCVINCDGTNATYGIQMANMKGSWIRNCVITRPVTAGIYVGAGDYAIQGGIERCMINTGVSAGAKGIHVSATTTVYNFRIHQNFVDVIGGGATAVGIHMEAADTALACFVTDNYVAVATGNTTALTTNQYGSLNNHVSVGGVDHETGPWGDDDG